MREYATRGYNGAEPSGEINPLAVQVMKEVATYSGRKSESDVIGEWHIQ